MYLYLPSPLLAMTDRLAVSHTPASEKQDCKITVSPLPVFIEKGRTVNARIGELLRSRDGDAL